MRADRLPDKQDVNIMRDGFIEGMLIATPQGRAKLEKKYPFMAQTEKGLFRWEDIFFAERGILKYEK